MTCCALADCGRPDCPVCQVGRQPSGPSAATVELPRHGDVAELPASGRVTEAPVRDAFGRLVVAPKRKVRIGPHR